MGNPYEVLDQGNQTPNDQATQNTETKQESNTTPIPTKGPGKLLDSVAIFFAKLMGHPNPITWENFKEEEKIITEKTEKKLEDIMWNVGNLLEKAGDKAIEKVNKTTKNINEKLMTPNNPQIKLDDIVNQDTNQIENKENKNDNQTIQKEAKEQINKEKEAKQENNEQQNEIKK